MQHIPNYHEINIKSHKADHIDLVFNKAPFFEQPIVIFFPKVEEGELYLILREVERKLKEKDVHPSFPFPIYLVSTLEVNTNRFKVFKSKKELTRYFDVSSKQNLNSKESDLLDRVLLLAEKLKGSNPSLRLREIAMQKERNRTLYMLTREAQFYEDLINKIKEK